MVGIDVEVLDGEDEEHRTLRVTARVADGESVPDPGSARVRALLYEDDVSGFDHVVRAVVLDDPLGISGSGEQAVFDTVVEPDPSWKEEDLKVVAWIQRGSDGEVLNTLLADWTIPTPTRQATWGSIKAGYAGDRGARGAATSASR
ncbi:MAG: hypothetical protein GF346_03970 [Candidatus Eisenbacteria bacterium]|nr:hypothetical protein [Candidatus Latescibacterota bacterium]MBD3301582.1 hypothetical protein [Candidatus Eisenbacteria bacterium]